MRTRWAFTLVELLLVIAIIALLVSMLMPSLQKAKELANDVVCKSNQKSLCYAIFLYAKDYDDAIPYSLDKKQGISDILLSWDVVIGKIPAEYIDKDWQKWRRTFHGFPNVEDHNSVEYRICAEGYVDYPSWGDNEIVPYEGPFVCPAFIDQVEPKATWPGATSCQFSINGNVSRMYREWAPGRELVITRLSDVRPKAVLIGDGNLGQAAGVVVVPRYRTRWDTGKLFVMDPRRGSNALNDFGPWTHQRHLDKWRRSQPCDFYGHPGGKANLTLVSGRVVSVSNIDGDAWRTGEQ